jgi:hypothetical protein
VLPSVGFGGYFDNIPGASLGNGLKDSGSSGAGTDILFSFDVPIKRFGILLSTGGATTWDIIALDGGSIELGRVRVSMPANDEAVFGGLQADSLISHIEIDEVGSNGQIGLYDDIRYEVPEPATLTLALMAALLVSRQNWRWACAR